MLDVRTDSCLGVMRICSKKFFNPGYDDSIYTLGEIISKMNSIHLISWASILLNAIIIRDE